MLSKDQWLAEYEEAMTAIENAVQMYDEDAVGCALADVLVGLRPEMREAILNDVTCKIQRQVGTT